MSTAALAARLSDFGLTIAADDQLLDAFSQGNAGEDLTGNRLNRYGFMIEAILRVWENTHYQYRIDVYDETEFDGQRTSWRNALQAWDLRNVENTGRRMKLES
jgi:hypothetical protein